VVGSILDGSAVYKAEGQPASVLQAADAFLQTEGEPIARFDAEDHGVTFGLLPTLPGQNPQSTQPGQ